MNIDWSKAPDWADAHGLHETGFGIKEFWLGETQHQNLEHAKSFPYGGGDPSCDSFHNSRRASFSYVTPRPAPWTGEGLPPIGTVCEIAASTPHLAIRHPEGTEVKIYANFTDDRGVELAAFVDGIGQVAGVATAKCFRPIRTPAQIAQQERERAIEEMDAVFASNFEGHRKDGLQALYDAGYRKQVAP